MQIKCLKINKCIINVITKQLFKYIIHRQIIMSNTLTTYF